MTNTKSLKQIRIQSLKKKSDTISELLNNGGNTNAKTIKSHFTIYL